MHRTPPPPPADQRRPDAPPHWPFGRLTPAQMRQRAAFERRMQAERLARWPEGLL